MKSKLANKTKIPSTIVDLLVALAITLIIIFFFFIVYHYFGGSKKLDTNITSFFGAILAFSGLMTKQYLYKETIEYLTKWFEVEELIDEIIDSTDAPCVRIVVA